MNTQGFDEDTPTLKGLVPAKVLLDGEAPEVSYPADAYILQHRRDGSDSRRSRKEHEGNVTEDPKRTGERTR